MYVSDSFTEVCRDTVTLIYFFLKLYHFIWSQSYFVQLHHIYASKLLLFYLCKLTANCVMTCCSKTAPHLILSPGLQETNRKINYFCVFCYGYEICFYERYRLNTARAHRCLILRWKSLNHPSVSNKQHKDRKLWANTELGLKSSLMVHDNKKNNKLR